MARLRYNGLSATLGASLTSSATSVTFGAALTHSNGTNVPTITGTDYIPLSILDATGHLSEIVYLTAYTSGATTGTIARGQEGTTGVSHASGDKIVRGPLVADSQWNNAVSLPLSTLTGWTAGNGAWAISSSVIRQSNVNSTSNRLRYTDAKIPQGLLVAEMDVKIDTAGSTTTSRAGFVFNFPSGADADGGILCALKSTVSGQVTQVYWEYEGVSAGPGLALPSNIALGNWITFRVQKVGTDLTAWVNGTQIGTVHINQSSNVEANTLALYSYQTDASFRNLNVWVPTQP